MSAATALDPVLAFAVGVLATWRVARLVAFEDGPLDAVLRLRRRAGAGRLGRAMDCPHCLGLWLALPVAAWQAGGWVDGLVLWLATAGGASLAQRASEGAAGRPGAGDGHADVDADGTIEFKALDGTGVER